MVLVYRFQNTQNIETESYCEDIMNIWLDYKGEESEDFELNDELLEDIYFEWEPFINQRLSTKEFAHLTPNEWIEKMLSFEKEKDVLEFQMKYKLEGVFAIEPTQTLEEAFIISKNPELGLHNKYLVVAEANVIEEFKRPFGLLVEIESIVNIVDVPKKYQKKE